MLSTANSAVSCVVPTYYPPVTSKWNKIEHRMFSFSSKNLKGEPPGQLRDRSQNDQRHDNKKGLRVQAILDKSRYETRVRISPQQMQELNIKKH